MSTETKEPLYHAKRELASAEKAIRRMSGAQSIEDLEDEWKNFLNSIEKVWVKAERSCQHIRNEFQPWQGKFARERKKDALLKYIKHARNSDNILLQKGCKRKTPLAQCTLKVAKELHISKDWKYEMVN